MGALLHAEPSARDVAKELETNALDPESCYRITELNFSKQELKIYLTSGFLTFAKPVQGRRMAAIFTGVIEGGDAEVLLIPPTRSERLSLANFTGSPTLDEHFKTSLLLFTDSTADELLREIEARGWKNDPNAGASIAAQYTEPMRNITAGFQTRLVLDLLSRHPERGFFYMGMTGGRLGTFDVSFDSTATEQLAAGQIGTRNGQPHYDLWTTFASKKAPAAQAEASQFVSSAFKIDSTIAPDLNVHAVTTSTIAVTPDGGRVIPVAISRLMRITEANVDGEKLEVFASESVGSNLRSGGDDQAVLLVAKAALDPGRPHQLEIHHQGQVIIKAGAGVLLVTSRGTWYPRTDGMFARFDLTFRYPKDLVLAATGEPVSDIVEGDQRVTRRRSVLPIRYAGFNLGDFDATTIANENCRIQIFANRHLESGLRSRSATQPPAPANSTPNWTRRRLSAPTNADDLPPVIPPNPAGRQEELGREVSAAFTFMNAKFGEAPIRNLDVSPIPAAMGQGFPGLLYLSTLDYLNASERPNAFRGHADTTFFGDVLEAHEVAHQWWGNLVIPARYQDDWLMESLANYSALLLVEQKKSVKALDAVLAEYRAHLLTKTADGQTLEQAGPITWGYRLQSSPGALEAWRSVTYEKGTWIIHMIRRQLGDAQFMAMLREMCRRYRFQAMNTEQFRAMVEEFGPKKGSDFKTFFDTWVYGTGIPSVQLNYSVSGLKLNGTLTTTAVPEDFTAAIPIAVQTGAKRSVYWLTAGSDAVPFSISLTQVPAKVTMLTGDCLILQK